MLFFILSPSTELKEEELSFYREAGIRNFIFFKRHFEDDFSEYLKRLKQALKGLFLLCVDQEGGRVARIPGDFPSPLSMARQMREKGDKAFREWAKSLAKAVKSQGLNVNLAPCVDLADEKAPDFLRERTFGLNPEEVIECAKLFYYCHEEEGIATCLKHFPGLGGVEVDPHEDLPRKSLISEKDLKPFKSLSSLYPMVMTTHLSVSLDEALPSTFSERIVRLLREDCNFKGLILTDDLNMKGFERV
jgi:Beta-glucosidase-related glycosidases